jgi:hypothetical protein
MARAMNVSKRVTAAKAIVAKTLTSAQRADRMAEELMTSFGEMRTPEGKEARDLARQLTKLSGNLKKTNAAFAKAF